jgi:LuxR family maltose regulon positive regulatory protein
MHHALASCFSDELRTIDPGSWHASHCAAAKVAEEVGDLDAAVYHARRGDDDSLSAVVWRSCGPLLGAGRTPVLRQWIGSLSDETLCSRAGLSLAAAWVAGQEGDTARMSRFALAAEAAAQEEAALLPDVRLLRATIAADGLECMRADASYATVAKPPDDVWLTLSYYLEGMAEYLLGRTDAGMRALGHGYRLALILGTPTMHGLCLAALADAAFAAGDRARALDHVRELREVLVRHRLARIATMAPVLTASAAGYVAEARFQEARQEAARAMRLTSMLRAIAPWYAVQGRIALANVYLSTGDVARAAALGQEAEALYGPASISPILSDALAGIHLRMEVMLDDVGASSALTSAEVRVLQFLPTHMSFPQIAAELSVSRHTVKTQALATYRKLGAHTRTEAVEKARDIGLLPRLSTARRVRRD